MTLLNKRIMFSNLRNIGLLLLLVYAEQVICTQLAWKARDFNQPFIIIKERTTSATDTTTFYSASIPISYDKQFIHYDSKQNTLISACPSDRNMALIANAEIKTPCENDFKPKVSEHPTGDAYSVGYLFSLSENHDISTASVLVDIFYIHYSEQHGLLFTSHEIHPGPKITLDEWEKEKKESKKFVTKFPFNPLYFNEVQIQLVPFEDLIPIPWKIATLVEVNFIYAPQDVKEGLDKLNDFLRNHVNEEGKSLKIYSGVKDKSWYWKVVRQEGKGLLIFVADEISDQQKGSCQNQCEEFGLGTLKKQVLQLRCCLLTETMAKFLKIRVTENNKPAEYLHFEEALIFEPNN